MVINRRFAVLDFLNQFFGFVNAVGNLDAQNRFTVKARHFDIFVGGDDDAVCSFDFAVGQHVFRAAGAVGFDLNRNTHFRRFFLQRFRRHISMGDAGRAGGNRQNLIAFFFRGFRLFFRFGVGVNRIFLGFFFINQTEKFLGVFRLHQAFGERRLHEHNHQS